MNHLEFHSQFLGSISKLKHASRVPGGQNLDICFLDFLHFPIQDFHRQFVLCDVVNPGTTATLISPLNFYKMYAWNRFQQLSGLAFDSLSVNEMAWIVVAYTVPQWLL